LGSTNYTNYKNLIIFRDCKLYEDQRTTMMNILSENRKKEYPKSVTELVKARGEKICARRLLLHEQNSYIYLKIRIDM
jgi:hypothetical protein